MQNQKLKDARCDFYVSIAGSTVLLSLASIALYGCINAIRQYFTIQKTMQSLISPLNVTCYEVAPNPWAMAPNNIYDATKANYSGFSNSTDCLDLFKRESFFTSSILFLGIVGLSALTASIMLLVSLRKQCTTINELKHRTHSQLLANSFFPIENETRIIMSERKFTFNAVPKAQA